ncbi:alpha/beta hydrolase [Ulvibacterium marinum]|uniref:Alpha/beta hydrolase n=1 Tax=Ulvibacterium marinum TaxID=2419782 RepID=A0A3B0C5H3_9FLAO|nr:acetylxylan esterase [Ulvibacterium marinum]RKN80802.1 alpha/beta hydrolase [Ulvibacterium marinum]
MKSSKTVRNWGIAIVGLFLVGFVAFKMANDTSESLPVTSYYGYDRAIPLKDSVEKVIDTAELTLFSVSFNSIHDKRVTGFLSLPKKSTTPSPVIILMHGLGDHKAVDYVEYGNGFFLKNGFAVLRLDISDHGDRENVTYDFDLTGDYKYWTRNVIAQTVFDLRRAVDFIETRKELDSKRIGYYGISLGGIIGTVFCGVENRVKVPVIALAGGQLNLLYKEKAFSREAKDFMGIVEPLNFVKHIAPRPFLMLNAKNDEVVHPAMSKLLFNAAAEPKEMVWYDAKHKDAPIDRIYGDGLNWFKEYL